jgi:hypothetical protein
VIDAAEFEEQFGPAIEAGTDAVKHGCKVLAEALDSCDAGD